MEFKNALKIPKLKRRVSRIVKTLKTLSTFGFEIPHEKLARVKKRVRGGKEYLRIRLTSLAQTIPEVIKNFKGWFLEITTPEGKKEYRPIKKETEVKLQEGMRVRVVSGEEVKGGAVKVRHRTVLAPPKTPPLSITPKEVRGHELAEILSLLHQLEARAEMQEELPNPYERLRERIGEMPMDFVDYLSTRRGELITIGEAQEVWETNSRIVREYLIYKGELHEADIYVEFMVKGVSIWEGPEQVEKNVWYAQTFPIAVPVPIYRGEPLLTEEEILRLAIIYMRQQIPNFENRPTTERIVIVTDDAEIISTVESILSSIPDGYPPSGISVYSVVYAYPLGGEHGTSLL